MKKEYQKVIVDCIFVNEDDVISTSPLQPNSAKNTNDVLQNTPTINGGML